jgi:hypothetical protein
MKTIKGLQFEMDANPPSWDVEWAKLSHTCGKCLSKNWWGFRVITGKEFGDLIKGINVVCWKCNDKHVVTPRPDGPSDGAQSSEAPNQCAKCDQFKMCAIYTLPLHQRASLVCKECRIANPNGGRLNV